MTHSFWQEILFALMFVAVGIGLLIFGLEDIRIAFIAVAFALGGIILIINDFKKMKSRKNLHFIEQSNGLYSSANIVNTLQNNQNLEQQNFQNQQQKIQSQEDINNPAQGTCTQNTNFANGPDETNNQNNTNSNL